MYVLTVNLPNLPQGELVEVDGVGIFPNGSTTNLEEFNSSTFAAHHEKHSNDPEFNIVIAFADTLGVDVEGSEDVVEEENPEEEEDESQFTPSFNTTTSEGDDN